VSEYFTTIIIFDFEYEIAAGELPAVLCMVAYVLDSNLQHVRTLRLWRGEFGATPPFDTGPDTLFVAYSAWAEMTCFMVLGWKFPVHIFDLHTAYLAASNILLPHDPDEVRKKPRKRLSDACRAYDIAGWEQIDKEAIARAIGEGRWHDYGQGELLRQYDPSYGTDDPIYTPEGEWSYGRFGNWLTNTGVTAWPRLESGQYDTDGDAFRLMYHVLGIEKLHALKDSLGVIVRAKLPIGADGRNRPSLYPFATATGRNAHAKSLYNAHAGMRSFMVFPLDTIGVYLDWRSQEVGIAAALSGDEQLKRDYSEGDVYYALAKLCGLTNDPDLKRWKRDNPAMRDRMKPLQLGINYGMGVPSLAKGLNRHPLIASTIIERHKQTCPRFWQWREERVQCAMLDRQMETVFGWPLYLSNSPNKRTLYNFPMQGNGAECLRLAATRLCEAGIVPSMLVHDAVLLEVRDRDQIAQAIEIMKAASRDVCGGFEIGVGVDQLLENGARYQDKRPVAKQMWATIMRALADVRAISEEQSYGQDPVRVQSRAR
jgi:DNA polymerase I